MSRQRHCFGARALPTSTGVQRTTPPSERLIWMSCFCRSSVNGPTLAHDDATSRLGKESKYRVTQAKGIRCQSGYNGPTALRNGGVAVRRFPPRAGRTRVRYESHAGFLFHAATQVQVVGNGL